jgi:hypothetical protein
LILVEDRLIKQAVAGASRLGCWGNSNIGKPSAAQRWLGAREGRSASVLPVDGQRLRVLLASDAGTLTSLEAAAA